MRDQYEDILYLPHHQSKRHRPMRIHDRAAQFAPFAALSGYEESVENQTELSEEMIRKSEEGIWIEGC